MLIKPRAGLRVLDPISFVALKEDGEEKPESQYWVRALRSGDVERVAPAAPVVVDQIQIPDSSPTGESDK